MLSAAIERMKAILRESIRLDPPPKAPPPAAPVPATDATKGPRHE
jgi:hypothetical protein